MANPYTSLKLPAPEYFEFAQSHIGLDSITVLCHFFNKANAPTILRTMLPNAEITDWISEGPQHQMLSLFNIQAPHLCRAYRMAYQDKGGGYPLGSIAYSKDTHEIELYDDSKYKNYLGVLQIIDIAWKQQFHEWVRQQYRAKAKEAVGSFLGGLDAALFKTK